MPHRNSKICFWHIPKTGGRWVLEALSRRWAKAGLSRVPRVYPEQKPLMLFGHHAPPSEVPEKYKKDRFHFCFVRKPLNWYISWWAYRILRKRSDKRHYADRYHDEVLDTFINNVLDANPDGFVNKLFKLYVGENVDQMNYVGHTETLLEDLKEALNLAGQPVERPFDTLPPKHCSSNVPHIAERIFVEPETIARVNLVEHWVLDTFYDDSSVYTVAPVPATGRDLHYSSHMPLLLELLHQTSGPVLELGAGWYSTPLIHWACAAKRRYVLTLEHKQKFFEYASQFADTWHKVVLVKDWDKYPFYAPNGEKWGLAFVDHNGPRRGIDTKRLAYVAEIVICHDTCGRDEKKYHYQQAWPLYKYRYQTQLVRPKTTVASNVIDVGTMGLP